ncbi:MAG: sugar phosphate isomerase/epimerase [Planctomycetota bacterium]|nr:sugar phosphate isomerase/epimerase [Planctomycetota bacterium]
MIRPAFSTVACPTWTLERVTESAALWGYMGVELRSFGAGAASFACDPALTAGQKVRRLFDDAGLEVAGVASGLRFDQPVFPPVLGHLLPAAQAAVNEGRHMVEVASAIEAGYLRVFAFDKPRSSRRALYGRIRDRLAKVCDHARNRDVMVLLENGGGFASAHDLLDLAAAINSPQLGFSYDVATGAAAGDTPAEAIEQLGPRLAAVRLRDQRSGTPCILGEGDVPCMQAVRALRASDETWGTDPWVVVTWDRAWLPELAPADDVLPASADIIVKWAGGLGSRHRYEAFQSAAPAMMMG